jgi:hypothetical protein
MTWALLAMRKNKVQPVEEPEGGKEEGEGEAVGRARGGWARRSRAAKRAKVTPVKAPSLVRGGACGGLML